MPRRLLSASVLALLALVSLSQRSYAKPPDLPHIPVIIVQGPGYAPASPQLPVPLGNTRPENGGCCGPIRLARPTPPVPPVPPPPPPPRPPAVIHIIMAGPTLQQASHFALPEVPMPPAPGPREMMGEAVLFNIHPLMHFLPPDHFTPVGAEEPCEEEAKPACPRSCGQPCDKHACAIADACATRIVLDHLRAMRKADKSIRKAKKLMERGRYHEAAERLAHLAEKMRALAEEQARAAEEAAAEAEDEARSEGCTTEPFGGRFRAAQQFGLCRFTAAAEAIGLLACSEARCEAACFPGVEGKLCLPVCARFVGVPLADALSQLGGTFGVPIVIERDQMKLNGVDLSSPVSLHVDHMPLRVALDVMLRPLGLEPVVKGRAVHITCAARATPAKCDGEACEPCPEAQRMHEAHRAGVKAQVDGLFKACYLAVEAKRYAKAAELARQAHALDPARVEADPMVYKMHLLGAEGCPMNDEPAVEPPAGCPAAGEAPGVSATPHCASQIIVVGDERARKNVIRRDVPLFPGQALPAPVVTEERSFEVPVTPAGRGAYLDDRAFRGADEKEGKGGRCLAAGLGLFLLDQMCPTVSIGEGNGCLALGLLSRRVNLYCKAPCKGRDVHIVICGYLPLVWITPAEAAE
jgi:hypothetical protein